MMTTPELEVGSQSTFVEADIETGTSFTASENKNVKNPVFSSETSEYCYSVGVGFFCSTFYTNILVAPLILQKNRGAQLSVMTYVTKIACFVLAYIFALFMLTPSVASFLFLCFAYVPYFSNL